MPEVARLHPTMEAPHAVCHEVVEPRSRTPKPASSLARILEFKRTL